MSGNLPESNEFHATLSIFYMPQIYDMGQTALLPLRRNSCWGFLSPWKIRRLRPGLNPRTWVLKASTQPLDHRSQSTCYDAICKVYTGLFEMTVRVLTTCHTQYTSDSSICIYLFNRTTLQVFVTCLTGALYVHLLWFYKHQHDNRMKWNEMYAHKTPSHCRHLSELRSKRRNA
jgi:hypothetical protein